eukprot:CAMPEP_0197632844 /NCGR_PEP_ID=MMETSP1338-20131121/9394_1 /TAXON_ID=43686 ORGANISM="Pelagodinium beii, Strain RCC1491" /NCGR_SAMPLE_ID=MMETSP1338 /ASSEMBLY_ACC=CAM_ASM_000754 /LENGTH=724 /DNA_ID=CAMNT_0043204415 /DNA_START=96 /DNA_END=2270 /DNA_ORIENTATION=+
MAWHHQNWHTPLTHTDMQQFHGVPVRGSRSGGGLLRQSHSATAAAAPGRFQAPSPSAQTQRTPTRQPMDLTNASQVRNRTQPPGGSAQAAHQSQALRPQQQLLQQQQVPLKRSSASPAGHAQKYIEQVKPPQRLMQAHVGGSSSSAVGRTARRKRRDHFLEEMSDDDDIGNNYSFNAERQSLLAQSICYIHSKILEPDKTRQDSVGFDEALYFREDKFYPDKLEIGKYYESVNKTEIKHVTDFVLQTMDDGSFSVSELICSLILLSRLNVPLIRTCWRPLWITALLLTDKIHEDVSVKTRSMCELFPVLASQELFDLEVRFMRRLSWSAMLKKTHLKAMVKELRIIPMHMEVTETVKNSKYVRENPAFKSEDEPVSNGQHMLQSYDRRADVHMLAVHSNGHHIQQMQQVSPLGHSGGGCPVMTKPSFDPRKTLRQRNLVESPTPTKVEDGDATGAKGVADADRRAELDGISPRRNKAPIDADRARAAHRSPRQMEHAPAQANTQSLSSEKSRGMLPKSTVHEKIATFENGPRRVPAAQSPRRHQGSASGPSLAAGRHSQPGPFAQVTKASPRDDPCTLTVAEKKASIEAKCHYNRAESTPVEFSRSRQVQELPRTPTKVHPGHLNASQARVLSDPTVRGMHAAANQYHYAPKSRTTLPMQAAGRPVVNAQTVIGAHVARPVVQQGPPPTTWVPGRGRSASPAALQAGQAPAGYQFHPGPVAQRR